MITMNKYERLDKIGEGKIFYVAVIIIFILKIYVNIICTKVDEYVMLYVMLLIELWYIVFNVHEIQ